MIARELAKVAQSHLPPAERLIELDEDDEGRAVRLFQGMATQWNWSVMGAGGIIGRQATGLRYEALPAVSAALGLTVGRQIFADLQLIEAEALSAMAAAR